MRVISRKDLVISNEFVMNLYMTKTRAFIKGNFSRRQHKKSFSVGYILILGTLSMNEDTEKDKNKKNHYKCLYIYI